MNKNDCFQSERLRYAGITEKDAESIVKWRSDSEIISFFRIPVPTNLSSHLEWFHNSYLSNDKRFDFIITDKATGVKIGTVGINAIDYTERSCEISYMIAERDFRRKGLASEAVSAMIGKISEEGICTFFAEIHRENLASIYMIKKMGFRHCSQKNDFVIFRRDEE